MATGSLKKITSADDIFLNIGSISTERTITASGTASFLLVTYGNADARQSMHIVRIVPGGGTYVTSIKTGSAITITEGTNLIKVKSSSSAFASLYGLTAGSISVLTVSALS